MKMPDIEDFDLSIQQKAEIEEWKGLWPKYCRGCDGWGGASFSQSIGYGLGSETLYEVCDCVLDRKCPRCGTEKALNEDGDGVCSSCGWDSERPKGVPWFIG